MKLVLKNPENIFKQRLSITRKEEACLDSSWHYHPQFELIYISKSTGIRFVGDSVSNFSAGDLVLVGSNLPHLWRNDPSYYKDKSLKNVQTVVIKFLSNFLGESIFNLPEFSSIKQMLKESKFGLHFKKSVSKKYHDQLIELVDLRPANQSIKLLALLQNLSLEKNRDVLSSTDMCQHSNETSKRLDSVIKYISDNYANDINLEDVAQVACMTTNSFCRFFKKNTNKSFTQFLNEVRVRNASILLLDEQNSVASVSDMVGYNSITHFYKQFKHIMGCTPNLYRQPLKLYQH